ncbi:MAG: UDP-N-acetylglucosamine 1-carboxyvinyltransferase [Ruminococcaceae bacterium]|nr:UDP-N-acetylglucosamine 1-carboxyvinyltransferase [Oscillospiraceae bacterium]
MGKIVITGGRKLSGRIKIPGAKNTVLPILAATLISGKKSIIIDCPKIKDVELTLEILKDLGCKISWEEDLLIIDSSDIRKTDIKEELMDKMRSSIILTGAVLSRMGEVRTTYPGGCELGLRPIDLHIKAFKKMGIFVEEKFGYINFKKNKQKDSEIHLDFPSVGATENIMLAASTHKGKTKIINAAKEPEIEDLQKFLCKMGVKVSGAGTSVIEIVGTNTFYEVTHKVIPDRIVASTYMVAGAITDGDVILENVNYNHISSVAAVMDAMGVEFEFTSDHSIRVKGNGALKSNNLIRTLPYPGFPTDAQSIIMSLLSIAKGTGMIIENIFDSRFKHVEELKKMGADITISDRCAVIKGVKKLYGARVNAPDLRSGAGLVVAGLCADGVTEVSNTHYIRRGYEDIVRDLQSLGADIIYK